MRRLTGRRPRVGRLARRGDVAGLIDALTYEDPLLARSGQRVDLGVEIRLAAVQALAAIGGADAGIGLTRALADPEPGVRAAAVRGLSERGADGIDALADAAAGWREPEYEASRAHAVAALALPGDAAGARAFTSATLASGHEPTPQDVTILRELGQAQDGQALDVVIAMLAGQLTAETGARPAAILLGWLGPESVPALLEALDQAPARPAACMALGATHDARAVEPLCDLLRHSDDVATRSAAARALGEIMDPAAAEALMIATGDPEYAVRVHAIDSFNRLGNVAVTVALGAVVRGALRPATSPQPALTSDGPLLSGEPLPADETGPRPPLPAVDQYVGHGVQGRESVWRRVLGR